MSKRLQTFNQGFTLVELSIVLIIIGFLIAGIAAGSSMIKSAQINSIITDFQRYQTSYNNFIGRYAQAPGDFNNASNIWGATCDNVSGLLCNGNADGKIGTGSTASKALQEVQAAWKDLALSGMVSSSIAYVDGSSAAVPGTNVPLSKLLGAGYNLVNGGTDVNGFSANGLTAGVALWGTGTSVNMIMVGKPTGTSATTVPTGIVAYSAVPPVDAYSMDTKLDDGNPVTGIIRSSVGADTSATIVCLQGTTAATAQYLLSSTVVGCVVGMAVNN